MGGTGCCGNACVGMACESAAYGSIGMGPVEAGPVGTDACGIGVENGLSPCAETGAPHDAQNRSPTGTGLPHCLQMFIVPPTLSTGIPAFASASPPAS